MKGKTEPRIFTPPLRKLTPDTTLGYAAIAYANEVLGVDLYPWQEWELIHSFEIIGDLDGEWLFRFRVVVDLLSRQNGKTVLSKVKASFLLNVLGIENLFGTSLSMDKAEETWEAVVEDQENIPSLAAEIKKVVRNNGKKKLVLTGNRSYHLAELAGEHIHRRNTYAASYE